MKVYTPLKEKKEYKGRRARNWEIQNELWLGMKQGTITEKQRIRELRTCKFVIARVLWLVQDPDGKAFLSPFKLQ
jgi:hypothetical protein